MPDVTGADTASARSLTLAAYRRLSRRRAALAVALALAAFGALLLDIGSGSSDVTAASAFRALVGWGEVPRSIEVIVWQVRLPMALMALLVGAALALAGAEMQTVLGNPLAEPFTLGVSAAAALGAALAIVLGVSAVGAPAEFAVPANAFLFALGSLLLLLLLSRVSGAGPDTLVLFGIALGFAAQSLLALVQFVATADSLQQLVFWSMGSLSRANMTTVGLLAAALALVAPFSFAAAWRLTALRLGDERARSFGVDVARLRVMALARVSLLAAGAVAFVGVVGFVGLVGPHVARMLVGEDHRYLLPASALCGALAMSLASILSKMIVPGVILPIGLVTALVGLPVFVALILRRGRR
ncbi:FecCD family ABC transporter permease [Methylopila musalis]|uniref:FecCD family ABC transporter permease n=1 Tax=Methylopila musalis TaxID=1134781 RepID=A0ABW3ZAQ3_9HYPH